MSSSLVSYQGTLWTIIAESNSLGIRALTLAGLPRRAYTDAELKTAPALVHFFVDYQATNPIHTLSRVVAQKLGAGESWLASSRRGLQSLLAWFLLAEDRQRRLVVREVSPLMHQLSLVEHVLREPGLSRVLIGDEVGLGKTVEAGLIAQRLLTEQPDLRVLYLSPARLVRNVVSEFRRLGIDARSWVAGGDADARISSDRVVIGSMQRAVRETNRNLLVESGPWDLLIVDECHHLSDWEPGGGSPNAGYRLITELIAAQRPDTGRLLLLSGTPHQGHQARFENLLALLRHDRETDDAVAGRVIYRTKEAVRDWHGRPLFPRRDVRPPTIARLGEQWAAWYDQVGDLYDGSSGRLNSGTRARAGGWAKGQALQWVASSVEAGLAFLVRLAIRRLNWTYREPPLADALMAIRPYRGGSPDEPIEQLYDRIARQMPNLDDDEDSEELLDAEPAWRPDAALLASVLEQGVQLRRDRADGDKWRAMEKLLREASGEKVVLFCQPVETVGVVARYIEEAFGSAPSVIIGGQSEEDRDREIERFRDRSGSQFLVSSRAGGEGLNLQVSRRLIHLDIPWNPMDLEQRVGRIHRFGSRQVIFVDTIVVPGTREADAYRIAREKLRLIAGQLDPEKFELLFSRVMNLVPPEELAGVFGENMPWSQGGETEQRIASIVKAGYERLSRFTDDFSAGAARMRSIDPGAAKWSDLRAFLTKACNANPSAPATKPVFSVVNDEIVAGDSAVETLDVFGRRFACDETDGLPCFGQDGKAVTRIGIGDAPVVAAIRERLLDSGNRLVAVRLPHAQSPALSGGDAVIVFVALQRLAVIGGTVEERGLELRAFCKSGSAGPFEIERSDLDGLVREICDAERQARPDGANVVAAISQIESAITETVSTEARGTPVGQWPAICVLLSTK